jgi:hypothetical protein
MFGCIIYIGKENQKMSDARTNQVILICGSMQIIGVFLVLLVGFKILPPMFWVAVAACGLAGGVRANFQRNKLTVISAIAGMGMVVISFLMLLLELR